MKFTAIDFETAVGPGTACAIGMVTVEDGEIIDEYYKLIKPPENRYSYHTTRVHGLTSADTYYAPQLPYLIPDIKSRLVGRTLVAHNESFDRNVLKKSMAFYGMDYDELGLPDRWECTVQIYRAKGFKPCNLNVLCDKFEIELDHHQALSDARGCALLYLRHLQVGQ